MGKVAIVIVAHNRPLSLNRLLNSISKAIYPDNKNVQLIISIDYGGSTEVEKIAVSFDWKYGEKKIIKHKTSLGLKSHIISCGDLTEEYDNIILLEDDLYVSPYFFIYSNQALEYFSKASYVCGISLYSYYFNEFTGLPFFPLSDGFDNIFIQTTSSWGQIWTREHWKTFRSWFNENKNDKVLVDINMPRQISEWPETSWKKYFIAYQVVNNKYFVFPRISFTTNFADKGTHINRNINLFQTPLLFGQQDFNFCHIKDSLAVYDSFFEIDPLILKRLNSNLSQYDFLCDLYGQKNLDKQNSDRLILSIRETTKRIIGFSDCLIPQEANIAEGLTGNFFSLSEKPFFSKTTLGKKIRQVANLSKQNYITNTDMLFSKIAMWPLRKIKKIVGKFIG